ncbi:hypothetical protein ACQKIE_09890 [Luteibacter sp. NPDC031894]|uniref:hypothetical protein n=1 Tax=Luteibacter sp. NPDC031894 TaxID=3390572 RepID=UPI003D060CDF
MNNAIQKDRAGFLERLGQLAGTTAWREPGRVGGGTPYAARGMATENALVLALAMARRNPKDKGPDIAYSLATQQPYNGAEVVAWLAEKLAVGTGRIGERNAGRMVPVATQAYEWIVGTRVHPDVSEVADAFHDDFRTLYDIAQGWLWMAMEAAVERAERAMYSKRAA